MSQDNSQDKAKTPVQDPNLAKDAKQAKDVVPPPDTPEGAAYADYLAKRVSSFVESLNAVMFPRPGDQVVDTKGYVRAYPPTIHVQPKTWWDDAEKAEKAEKDKKEVKDEEPPKPKPGTPEKQG